MTLLLYTSHQNTLYAMMDTLGKTNETDIFLEKHCYLEKPHVLIFGKGVLNIISLLFEELSGAEEKFENYNDVISYVKEELPDIIKLATQSCPTISNNWTRIHFLYFDNGNIHVFRAEYNNENTLIYSSELVSTTGIHTSNDVSMENEKVQSNFLKSEIYKRIVNERYGDESAEFVLAKLGINAHYNDPPGTYIGGKLLMYKMSDSNFEYYPVLVFDDDQPNSYISMSKAVFLTNGHPFFWRGEN